MWHTRRPIFRDFSFHSGEVDGRDWSVLGRVAEVQDGEWQAGENGLPPGKGGRSNPDLSIGMPGFAKFLHGFGIRKGLHVGNYVLDSVHGSEETITRYHEYQYHMELLFTPTDELCDPRELVRELTALTKGSRIIKSGYGNPYSCVLHDVRVSGITEGCHITISAVGHSERVYR